MGFGKIAAKGKGGANRATPYAAGGDKVPDEGRMVYVGGLPFKAEWQELKDHMGQAGTIEFASVLSNEMGNSKGTGFVRYSTEEEAQNAVLVLNGSMMMDKIIKVDMWTGPKPQTQKGGMATSGGGKGFMGMPVMMGGKKGGKGGGMFLSWDQIQQLQFGGGMMMPMMGGFGGKGGKGGGKKPQPDCKVKVEGIAPGVEWQELKDHFQAVGTVEFTNVKFGVGEVRFSTPALAKKAVMSMNGSDLMGSIITVTPWE